MIKYKLIFILFLSIVTIIMSGGGDLLSAASEKIDWNEYDKYYDYEEKSPMLAVGTSIIPIWSGSFNAGFNSGGLYYVVVKSAFTALMVKSYTADEPVYYLGWQGWMTLLGIAIIYDMVDSYNYVKISNKKYASFTVSPRIYCKNDLEYDESLIQKNDHKIEGMNFSAIYHF